MPDDEVRDVPEWAQGDPLMEWYATEVWGKRVTDDDALFEIMSLQIFQAGLSWRMILARRDAFRAVFHGWRIPQVAAMSPDEVDRALLDPSIIRQPEEGRSLRFQCPDYSGHPAGTRFLLPLVLRRAGRNRVGAPPEGT